MPASQASQAPSLSQPEETVYDHVFVRIDCDLAPRSTAVARSCAGTAKAAGDTVAISNRNSEPFANTNARSITNTTRSDVDADIQRTQNALDWSSIHFRPRRWLRRRSDEHLALLRGGRIRRCLENSQLRHYVDADLR